MKLVILMALSLLSQISMAANDLSWLRADLPRVDVMTISAMNDPFRPPSGIGFYNSFGIDACNVMITTSRPTVYFPEFAFNVPIQIPREAMPLKKNWEYAYEAVDREALADWTDANIYIVHIKYDGAALLVETYDDVCSTDEWIKAKQKKWHCDPIEERRGPDVVARLAVDNNLKKPTTLMYGSMRDGYLDLRVKDCKY